MKSLQLVTLLAVLTTGAASATTVQIDEKCDVQLNGNMQYENSELTITTDEGKKIKFTDYGDVFVDNEKLKLSRSEQSYAKDYYGAVEEALPLSMEIAVDGVELASETLNQVFGELLGQDDAFLQDLDELFVDIRSELDDHFYNEQGVFTLNGSDLEHKGWASNTWGDKFDERVDDMVSKAVGKLMMSIGSELLFGSDEASDTLARLENLDETIEQQVEPRVEIIEAKAYELCAILEKADTAEDALRYSNDKLAGLNIITLNQEHAM